MKGLDDVMENLAAATLDIEGKTMQGAYSAGLFIQRESQKRAPVDTGNLKGSAYTRRTPSGNSVEVGYTAAYAASVHEMVGQKLKGEARADFGTTRAGQGFGGGTGKGRYWDSGQPKFLQSAIQDNFDKILDIIRSKAKIK